MSQGAQTQACTPGYSIYLNSGPLSGQILWGKWPQRGFCRLLIQRHWHECAYSMPKICVLCSTLNFSKVNSALPPCSVALLEVPPHTGPAMLPNHFHQSFTQRAGSMGPGFFLSFLSFLSLLSFLKEIVCLFSIACGDQRNSVGCPRLGRRQAP